MTSSNGSIFCVTGPSCGEFTGHRWIPLTKASDAELWCLLWSAPEQTVVHNRDGGDFKRHRAHYDATVVCTTKLWVNLQWHTVWSGRHVMVYKNVCMTLRFRRLLHSTAVTAPDKFIAAPTVTRPYHTVSDRFWNREPVMDRELQLLALQLPRH